MKKLLFIAFLFIVNLAFGDVINPDGTLWPDIDWYVKDIKAKEYKLHTPNELAGFAALVNGTTEAFSAYDFTGKIVSLANDIDMKGYVDENGLCFGPKWIPIGITYSCRFAGEFDGKGFAIKNLIVNSDQIGTLFGYNSGVIRNLVIAGGMVCSDYYGAGVCAYNSGTIDHCINTANIFCNNYGGGICGKNYENGKITYCINLGFVLDGRNCGGIVGSTQTNAETYVRDCVYDNQMCPLKKGSGLGDARNIKSMTTAQIVAGSGLLFPGFEFNQLTYPKLETSANSESMNATLLPVYLPDGLNVLNVNKPFSVANVPGVKVIIFADSSLIQTDTLFTPRIKSNTLINIKGGGCVRTVNFKITIPEQQNVANQGTVGQPIRIETFLDLYQFANAVNNYTHFRGHSSIDGFKNVNFAINKEIVIPDSVNWAPIGTSTAPFNGVFNGQGFAIANLNIYRPSEKYCGLFGYNNGNINSVVLVGGHVVGGDYTGGICGYSKGSVIGCLCALPVRGHYYTGGILGFNNSGVLKTTLYVNNVVGQPSFTGGICGGTLDGSVADCIFDRQMCTQLLGVGEIDPSTNVARVYGVATSKMLGNQLQTYLKDQFLFDDVTYPHVKCGLWTNLAKLASIPVLLGSSEHICDIKSFISLTDFQGVKYSCDQQEVLKITSDKALPLKQGAVVLKIIDGDVSKNITIRITNKALEPIGTKSNPLLINNFKDLNNFRKAVNYGTDYNGYACIDGFRGVYFRLNRDIHCPPATNQIPIGSDLFPFSGIFDGNGKTIINFNCQNPDMDNVGFFGYSDGYITNLRMSRSPILGRYNTGGVCGYNAGVVTHCYHDSATVSGFNYTGGICGFVSGEISKCTNTGSVKSDYYAGGVVGSNSGRVDTCMNTGIISGISCIGGLAGSNRAQITYGYNIGMVSGQDNVGGISGRNSSANISNCINKGVINGGDCSGGIAGLNDGTISISINLGIVLATISGGGIAGKGGKALDCINKANVSSSGNNAGGIVGVTKNTSEIIRCANYGDIVSQAFAGGICSDNSQNAKIMACVNFGEVDAQYYVGGVCGHNSGTLTLDFSVANMINDVTGNYKGAVCGRNNTSANINAVIEKCYYDRETCIAGGIDNKNVVGSAEGLSTSELKSEATLKSKIGDNISDFNIQNDKYPVPLNDTEKQISDFVAEIDAVIERNSQKNN